jgi:hypothetical protein
MKRAHSQSLEDMNYADYWDALLDERFLRRARAERARRPQLPPSSDSPDGVRTVQDEWRTPGDSANLQ